MIDVKINGQMRTIDASTIAAMLEKLSLGNRILVVEHNGAIIDPDGYDKTALADGDLIEIVHFVGGG